MKSFRLPDLGEGLQDAEIVSWHVFVGDHVVAEQPLVSVETAKAVIEIPSPWAGRIVALHGEVGDIVGVGKSLVDFDTDEAGEDAGTVVGTLPGATSPPSGAQGVSEVQKSAGTMASPAVRRMATDLALDIETIAGTGPGGSITRADLEAAQRSSGETAGFVSLRGVRRAMAEAMSRSGAGVVPANVTDEAVIEQWPADADVTARLVQAVVAGCRASPELNCWFDSSRMMRLVHERLDVGIAMETEDGLFVPVLLDAGSRSASDVRKTLETMKRKAAARSLPVAEMRGQTITLSNFGMLGGIHAMLTIVPPQVAILGAGRIHHAARVSNGKIEPVRVLPLSLTFDHRVVTGAEAVAFLNAVLSELERSTA